MFDYVRLDYMGVENGLQALFFKVSHKWNRLTKVRLMDHLIWENIILCFNMFAILRIPDS